MNWTTCSVIPSRVIFAPLRTFRSDFLLFTALTFWIVLLCSIRVVRRSLTPIEQLMEATHRVSANDFSVPLLIDSNDEFEELGDSFNAMAAEILDRSTRLEEATRVKMDFLANMSHELRTPMNAILGFSDLCRDPAMPSDDRMRHLEVVYQSSTHLLSVINDILDISKIEAGRLSVDLEPCDPKALIDEMLTLFSGTAAEKGLHLRAEVAESVPDAILTDVTRLRQILINLVGNGIKFTESGGVLIEVEGDEIRSKVVFFVSDTGVGMTAEQLGRVFDPFEQADSSTTRRFGGTGLGLSISSALARLLDGDLSCETAVGEGSRFRLELPQESCGSQEPSAALRRSKPHAVWQAPAG